MLTSAIATLETVNVFDLLAGGALMVFGVIFLTLLGAGPSRRMDCVKLKRTRFRLQFEQSPASMSQTMSNQGPQAGTCKPGRALGFASLLRVPQRTLGCCDVLGALVVEWLRCGAKALCSSSPVSNHLWSSRSAELISTSILTCFLWKLGMSERQPSMPGM